MTITTTVSWQDLLDSLNDELAELEDAYAELKAKATEDYGDDALDKTLPESIDRVDEDLQALWAYRTQMAQFDEAAKSIQKRKHVLTQLRDEYGDGEFEIRMLSGEETVAVETELRTKAQQKDIPIQSIQTERNNRVVDRAVVDAPDGFPTDDDGSPVPSQAESALTLALWEQVELLNNAGDVDFQAGGLGDSDPAPSPTADTSESQALSSPSSESAGE